MPRLLVCEVNIFDYSLAFEGALQLYVFPHNVQNVRFVVSENYLGGLCVLRNRKACDSGTTTKLNNCLTFKLSSVPQRIVPRHDDS